MRWLLSSIAWTVLVVAFVYWRYRVNVPDYACAVGDESCQEARDLDRWFYTVAGVALGVIGLAALALAAWLSRRWNR